MIAALVFALSVVLSVPTAVYGAAERRPSYLAVAAILALPLGVYLHGSPLFRFGGLVLPLLLATGAIAIKSRPWLGRAFVIPYVLAVLGLLMLVAGK